MAQLRQDYAQFVARGAEIVVVGPEGRDRFVRQWERERYPFIGLPDPEHTVSNLYGQQVSLLKFGRMPALVVVDKQGRAHYRHYARWANDIPANSEVLAVLDALNEAEGQA